MKKLNRLLCSIAAVALLFLVLFAWRAAENRQRGRPQAATVEAPATRPTEPVRMVTPPPSAPVQLTDVSKPPLPTVFSAFTSWAESYAAATPAAKAALLEEGTAKAKARHDEMLKLIKTDPKQALDKALPYRLRKDLPASIAGFVEKTVSGRGKLSVLAAVPLPGQEANVSPVQREATVGDESYQAHVYGRRLKQITQDGLALNGIAIGRELALNSDPGRVLDADEAKALLAANPPKTEPICSVSGQPTTLFGDQTVVDLGGQIHLFCRPSHAMKVMQQLAAGEMSRLILGDTGGGPNPTNPPPGTAVTFTKGRRTLLYIRIRFPDDPTEPLTESSAFQIMEGVNQFFVDGSYNTLSLATTVAPLVTVPHTKAYYGSTSGGFSPLQNDAREAAKAAGFYYLDYDLDIISFTTVPNFSFGGLAYVGARGVWLQSYGVGVTAHELGHNLGLFHANLWDTGFRPSTDPPPSPPTFPVDSDSQIGHDAVNSAGENIEYGDPWDTMGSGGGQQYNAVNKFQLKWISPQFVNFITASVTNRIYAFDTPQLTAGRLYALAVRKDSDRTYWASHRQLFPSNPWLANGVLLHWPNWAGSGGSSQLIDTTPGSINPAAGSTSADKNDAAVVVGRTYADAPANLYFTPIAKGGAAPEEYIDLVVQVGPFPTNLPPTLNLGASSTTVSNGDTVTFVADAQDPNGDALAYYWDFGDGTFGSNSSVVSKSFPSDRKFVVRCEVSDMKGGLASAFVIVSVGNPTTYVMSGQVVDTLGNPVQGLRVHNGLRNSSYAAALTDSQGNYAIGNQAPGNYTIDGFLYGYQTAPGFATPVGLSGSDAAFLDFFSTAIPTVSVTVATNADENGLIDGAFTITRTGDISQDLTVFYKLSGTAMVGLQYVDPITDPMAPIIIPAGLASTNVVITPIEDIAGTGPDTLTLQLLLATNETRVRTVVTNSTNILIITNMVTFPGWELLPILGQQTWFQTYPLYVLGQAEATMTIFESTEPRDTPTVSIFVLDDAAVETGGNSGTVVFTRTSSREADLVVHYSVSGTASNGVDYLLLPGDITIPAGQSSVFLPIVAIDDLLVEGNESVIINVLPDPSYISSDTAATVLIIDDDLPLLTVTPTDSIAGEQGANTGTFTFTRSGDTAAPLLVNYLVTGTAISGADFTALPGSMIIPAGQVSADVVVTPLTDNLLEGVETITVFVSSSPTYNIGTPNSATVFIQDAAQPTVRISASTPTAAEGGAAGVFTITRTGATNNSLLVNFIVGGTAIESVDYAAISTNVTIPVGSTTVNINVTPVDDAFRELSETVVVQLLPSTNYNFGGTTVATVTITDNDSGKLPAVGFVMRNSTVSESAGVAIVEVALSENPDSSKSPAVVEYHVIGGSAVNGADYSLVSTGYLSWVHINGGYNFADLIRTIVVPITNDTALEPNETIILQLFDPHLYTTNMTNGALTVVPTNASLGSFTAHTITIVDDDLSVVTITATNQYAYEAGQTPSAFLITRTGPTNASLKVNFEVTGTASARTDYQPLGTSITIPAGTNAVLLPLIPLDDNVEEYAETVIVTLLSSPGSEAAGSATIIIVDNDGTIQFTSANYNVDEGVGIALIGVQRSGDTNLLVSVDYTVSDGTATSGSDYSASNGRLIFPPGEVFQTIPIQIIDDFIVEPIETINLALSNPTGGVPLGGQSSAVVHIVDNDTGFAFATNNFRVNENGTNAVISINRLGLTNTEATVTFWTSDGTATNGFDYEGVTNIITFPAGVTNQTVLVPIDDDEFFEGDETVVLNLTNSIPGNPTGGSATGQLTIVDDECKLQFAAPAYSVVEYAGSVSIVVQRVGGTVNPVTVDFQTVDGTANSNDPDHPDFGAVSGTLYFQGDRYLLATNGSGLLEFHPGDSNQVIVIPILDDVLGEGNEAFSVMLSNPAGPEPPLSDEDSTLLGSPSTTVVTIIDNETPGNVDYEFNPGLGANDRVLAVALQPDLKIVFGGDFTTVDNISFNRICRLQPNGSIDTGFNPGAGINGSVYAVTAQPDGKVLVGGAFSTVDGTNRARIARLNGDGNLDLSFNPAGGANNTVRTIAVQSDGKVLLGGDFTQLNSVPRSHLARLNADGSLDANFSPSINNTVYALAVQSDGQIVVGGAFSSAAGSARNGIARLNGDGTIDNSFDPGTGATGPGTINTVAVQGDGKVLLGGAFNAFNGTGQTNLVRLLSTGGIDPGFGGGTRANAAVNSLAVQGNGKIVIGGQFSVYNGTLRSRFARLKPDGSLDTTFNPGTGADAAVQSLAVQPDSAVILGGDFTHINGLVRNHIARVHGDEKGSLLTVEFVQARFQVSETNVSALITVVRSGNTNQPFTITAFTSDGTASNGVHYVGSTNILDFAAGQNTQSFSIPVRDDGHLSGDVTVNLSLTNGPPNVDLSGLSSALLVILDKERFVQFAAATYFVDENATNALISLVRTGGLSGTVSVLFSTGGGSASAGIDYSNVSTVVTFADNEASKVVLIPIVDDTLPELAETVGLTLTNATGADLGTLTAATLTIVDNDLVYGTITYSNANQILILDASPASPYPSLINVSNLVGVISKVTVRFINLTHTFPADIEALLVGPEGQSVLLMSDAGGSVHVSGATLGFDDSAATLLPQNGPIVTSTNRPTDYPPSDAFYSPAPAGPYGSSLSVFNGGNPNGAWSLYIMDDRGSDSGVITNGWQLTVTTVDPAKTNDLSLTMKGSTNSIMAGQILTYTLLVTNNGPRPATGVTLTDTLPPGVNLNFMKYSQGGCTVSNGVINCNVGGIAVGNFATMTFVVTPTTVGTITNKATVTANETDISPQNNTAAVVTTVVPSTVADLGLTITESPNPAVTGQSLTYTLTVTNRGPLGATNVWMTNFLPANVKAVSASVTQGSYAISSNQIVVSFGILPNGGVATATIVAQAAVAGLITNSAVVISDQLDLTPDNAASVVTTVNTGADLSVTIYDPTDPVAVGGNATYLINVFNAGPDIAHGVTLFDTLPLQFTFASASSSQGSNVNASGIVIFDFGTIGSVSNVTATIVATPLAAGIFTNSVTVLGVEGDPNLVNNSAVEPTTVTTVAGGGGGSGIIVVPNTNANALASAIVGAGSGNAGISVTSASLIAHTLPSGEMSSGLYFIGTPPATYGLTVPGVILSSGNVTDYGTGTNFSPANTTAYDVPATAGQAQLLDPITTSGNQHFQHYDATELDIHFNMQPGYDHVTFHVVFGSEEYPVFVGSMFVDGFGIFLNGSNIAYVAGSPVNINHPAMAPLLGTELNGVLAPGGNPILTFTAPVTPGSMNNVLTFIISDTSDPVLDTTVYISSLQGVLGARADVSVSMTATPNPVVFGSNLTYQITVANAGPDNATNVVVTDRLPVGLNYVSAVPSQGSCSFATGVVTCALGNLPAGASAGISLLTRPTTVDPVTNIVTVTSITADQVSANNLASNVVTVIDLGVFPNLSSITIFDASPANPYPSIITVSNLTGSITKITATLSDLSHSYPADLDILLVGPHGQNVILMSDAGAGNDLNAVKLTFDDDATNSLPANAQIVTGTYKPTNIDLGAADFFVPPAPAGPWGTTMSVFNGTDPNGPWSLYIVDDQGLDSGNLASGWRLNIASAVQSVLQIEISGSVVTLSWPGSLAGFTLESRNSFSPTDQWTATGSPSIVGGRYTVNVGLTNGQFFRLRQ